MENSVNFTNFITKGLETEERDERRIVKGHITAEVVDRQDEFVAINEVLAIMKNYMDVNPVVSDYHSNRMVGEVLKYEKSEIEGHPSIFVETEIYKKDGVTLYDKVWEKVQKHEYKGFSMGGGSKTREPMVKNGKLIMNLKNLELYEIALCPLPANPLAVITYVNEFAKAANLNLESSEGTDRIQCNGVLCEITKDGGNVNLVSSGAYGDSQDQRPNNTKRYETSLNKSDSGEYILKLKLDDSELKKQVAEIIAEEHRLLGEKPDKKEEKIHEKLKEEFKKDAIDSDVDVDIDHTGGDKKLKEMQKPIRGHDWDYWDNKLKDDYPDKETRSKVIGSMEAEDKKKSEVKKTLVSIVKHNNDFQRELETSELRKIAESNSELLKSIN